jgi:hypothetical protein
MNTATKNVLLVSFKSFEKRFYSHQIFFLATERSKVMADGDIMWRKTGRGGKYLR